MRISRIQTWLVYCLCLNHAFSVHGSEPVVGAGEFAVVGESKCVVIDLPDKVPANREEATNRVLFHLEWKGDCFVKREGERMIATQKLLYAEKTKLLEKESRESTFDLVVESDGSLEYSEPLPFRMSYAPLATMPYETFGIGSGRFDSYVQFNPRKYRDRFHCDWFPSQRKIDDRDVVQGPILTHDLDNDVYGTGYMTRILVGNSIVESSSEWCSALSIDEIRKRKELLDAIPKRDISNVLAARGIRFQSKLSVKRRVLK